MAGKDDMRTKATTRATKSLADGQRAYEARRAAKAGVTLERWLEEKERRQQAAAQVQEQRKPPPPRKKGLISRLLDRAHQPLKPPVTKS